MAEKKRGLIVFIAIGAFLLYYFIASRPLLSELEFQPRWVSSLKSGIPEAGSGLDGTEASGIDATALPPAAEGAPTYHQPTGPREYVFPFKLGNSFGFADDKGRILFSAESPYGLSYSPGAWSSYESVHAEVPFRDPDGEELFKVATTGYPFILRDRFFIVTNDRSGIEEYGEDGKLAWKRDFPSVITCVDASAGLFLAGCLSGEAVLLGPGGETLSEFAPGGSRLPCVYGCAVSASGEWYALVSGVDKQRLVLLQRRSDGYKVAWHSYLDSDYRRAVKLAFSTDSGDLFFEQPGRLAILDVDSKALGGFPVAGEISTIELYPFNGIYLLLSHAGRDWTLSGFRLPGQIAISIPFSAYQAFLYQKSSAIYLGINESILRVDMKEN